MSGRALFMPIAQDCLKEFPVISYKSSSTFQTAPMVHGGLLVTALEPSSPGGHPLVLDDFEVGLSDIAGQMWNRLKRRR